MKKHLTRILHSSYTKIVLGGALAFSAAILGVYVGSAITNPNPNNGDAGGSGSYTREGQAIRMPEEYYPLFAPGDLFPAVDFEFVDGSVGNFSDLLQGRKSILLFVHFDCGACDRLIQDWRSWAGLNIRDDIPVIVCIGQAREEILPTTWDDLGNYEVVFVDREIFREEFNLIVWPTIACVDQYGLVTAIQVGYNSVFTNEIAQSLR